MTIHKWIVVEVQVTPKLLIQMAERLDELMTKTNIGNTTPSVSFKDWNDKIEIVLKADQDAWHARKDGFWK